MPTGERWAYAILLLHVLLCLHNVWPYVFYYDINCRFAEHLRAWAASNSGWSATLLAWVMAMPCPLPPFHAHMHAASCMAKNSHKLVYAAGSGVGEPPEQFNRYMGQCAMPLQYAAQWVRNLWLEVHMRCWNRRKVRLLPALLVNIGLKAADREQQLLDKQESLALHAVQSGLASEDEVSRALYCLRRYSACKACLYALNAYKQLQSLCKKMICVCQLDLCATVCRPGAQARTL